ncbi:8026_t:CDS:2 [Entrophospora sp. SA101]|nr:8026_t:CDS:2 [Entrophospora sp. SA101]
MENVKDLTEVVINDVPNDDEIETLSISSYVRDHDDGIEDTKETITDYHEKIFSFNIKKEFNIKPGKTIKWLVLVDSDDCCLNINVKAQKFTKKWDTLDEFVVKTKNNYAHCKLLENDDLCFATKEHLQILSFNDKKIFTKYIRKEEESVEFLSNNVKKKNDDNDNDVETNINNSEQFEKGIVKAIEDNLKVGFESQMKLLMDEIKLLKKQ